MQGRIWCAVVIWGMATVSVVAEPRTLVISNRSGETIVSIVAADKAAPEILVPFTLQSNIANGDAGDTSVDLPEGGCLLDVTFTLSSNIKVVQQDVDLCNIDGVVVE